MDIFTLVIISIPLVAFGIATKLAYMFGKSGNRNGLIAMGAIWVVFAIWMMIGMGDDPTWNGLEYFVAFMGVGLPTAVGAALGVVMGGRHRRKEQNA